MRFCWGFASQNFEGFVGSVDFAGVFGLFCFWVLEKGNKNPAKLDCRVCWVCDGGLDTDSRYGFQIRIPSYFSRMNPSLKVPATFGVVFVR